MVSVLSFLAVLIRASRVNMSVPLVVLSVFIFFVAYLGFPAATIAFHLPNLDLNLGLFLLLGCLTWFIFFVSAVLLNKKLVQSNVSKTSTWARYAATAFLVFAAVFAGLWTTTELPQQLDNMFPPYPQEIVLDASHVPAGETIVIQEPWLREYFSDSSWGESTVFFTTHDEGFVTGDFFDGELMDTHQFNLATDEFLDEFLDEERPPQSFTGQAVVVSYTPPTLSLNNPELLQAARPELSARLEGTLLVIEYSYVRDITIAYLPLWQVAGAFGMQSDQILSHDEIDSDWHWWRGFQQAFIHVRAE